MLAALVIVLPVFGLIFTGWVARRLGVLGPHATSELNRFVLYLAFPALLFDIMANARWADIWRPGFTVAYVSGAAVVFLAAMLMRLHAQGGLPGATIDGLNAGYANTGYVGLPLLLALVGPAAGAPTTITIIFNGCILFSLAVVLIEIGRPRDASSKSGIVLLVGWSLLSNPLLIAPCTGLLVAGSGWPVPVPVEIFVKLLGGTTGCCALVALGLFLGEARTKVRGGWTSRATLLTLKLIAQPAVTWVVAAELLSLPPLLTRVAVLLAATPTGTGSFVLAELYGLEAGVTSDVVLLTTVASIVTLPACLAMLG